MFDLLIVGGGPAGYRAAERAAEAGLSVALFEKRAVGGVCLNEGCIPTKTLLYSAKLFENMKNGRKYGVSCENPTLDYAAAAKRKDKVVKVLVAGIEAKLKALRVTIVRENAVIEGRSAQGFRVNGQEGKHLLICAGSEASLPPLPDIQDALTSREALALTQAPKTLAIVGGGVIGLEMASVFQAAGSQVTVYEALDKVGGPMDGEIAGLLQKSLAKKGIVFTLGARVESIASLGAEKTLVCVGRKPATQGLGLETLGVFSERGAIVTDDHMRTNIPGVWAAGDCNGKSMLAHTAYREAEAAVNDLLGRRDRMEYDAVPSVIYTNPEAAGCGETLETALAKGYRAEEKKLSMRYAGRFVAENEGGDGLCKVVVENRRVLGVHMIGNPASEIIAAAAAAIAQRMSLDALQKVIFPHPTVSEIIRETSFI